MTELADLIDIENFEIENFDIEGIDIEELDDGGVFGVVTTESSGDVASHDRRMSVLAELVSAAVATDRLLASVAAARAEAVDQVRVSPNEALTATFAATHTALATGQIS